VHWLSKVHADVASASRVGISAGISARVRVFEIVVAVLLLIPKTARFGAGLTVLWMSTVILSHIFVVGYGWFFVDALMVMALAVIYLLLTRRSSLSGRTRECGAFPAKILCARS